MTFVHHLRPRYAEVDVQGVVFNAHWLTYFDEASTRFFDWMGFPPAVAFVRDFDVMVVKAVVEWEGPAGFDDDVAIVGRADAHRERVVRPHLHRDGRRRARVHGRHHVRLGRPRHARLHADPAGVAREARSGRGELLTARLARRFAVAPEVDHQLVALHARERRVGDVGAEQPDAARWRWLGERAHESGDRRRRR